jgi:hypothetical protein
MNDPGDVIALVAFLAFLVTMFVATTRALRAERRKAWPSCPT